MFTSRPTTISSIEYFKAEIHGQGKTTAFGNIADIIDSMETDAENRGTWEGRRTVHIERLNEPDDRSISVLWGMAQAEARRRAEPQPHVHNILFNIRPRPRDPVLPLAGTVFDPRRYRRP